MGRMTAVLAALAILAGCGKAPTPDAGPPPARPASSQPAAPPTPTTTPAAPTPAPPRLDGPERPAAQPGPAPSYGNSGGTVVAEPSGAAAMPSIGEIVTAPVSAMIEQKRKILVFEAKDILRTYEAMNDQKPKSLEEAAAALNMKCPQPPEGWKWKYDRQTGEIDLVKE